MSPKLPASSVHVHPIGSATKFGGSVGSVIESLIVLVHYNFVRVIQMKLLIPRHNNRSSFTLACSECGKRGEPVGTLKLTVPSQSGYSLK